MTARSTNETTTVATTTTGGEFESVTLSMLDINSSNRNTSRTTRSNVCLREKNMSIKQNTYIAKPYGECFYFYYFYKNSI